GVDQQARPLLGDGAAPHRFPLRRQAGRLGRGQRRGGGHGRRSLHRAGPHLVRRPHADDRHRRVQDAGAKAAGAMSQPGQSNEGPLAPFDGRVPDAPDWFARITAVAPEDCFVEVEGTPIHYLRWGERKRPGLLLVHGNAAHAYWWSFIAPFLARDYNVAAMDLSGMGDSGWRETYSMETF